MATALTKAWPLTRPCQAVPSFRPCQHSCSTRIAPSHSHAANAGHIHQRLRCSSTSDSKGPTEAAQQAAEASGAGKNSADNGISEDTQDPAQQAEQPAAEEEEPILSPEIATLFLNFSIVFVVAFFIPSAVPGTFASQIGLPGITIGSAVVAALVAYLTWPKKQS
jgi:hypothetical protein